MTDPPVNPATGRRPRAGRPALLTDELTASIAEVVGAGNYLKTAAQFHGVGESTLLSWMARGRAAAVAVDAHGERPYHRLCPACDADRETEAQEVERHNRDADADAADPDYADRPRSYAVLGPCPSCRSGAAPVVWRLPDTEERYLKFLEEVTRAETQAEVAAVTYWRRSFGQDWRAARDYLARKRPDQWAAKTTVQIRPEEQDARINRATFEALTALGVDTDGLNLGDALADPDEPDDDG